MKITPKKSLGQHFLHSPIALAKIIEAGNIHAGDTVLEIGPGTGILTQALLSAGATVIAVEKDTRAFDFLRGIFATQISDGKLRLILGDILDSTLLTQEFITHDKVPYSIIANIPYYITGAILEKFLENEPQPTRMVLLVQKEVAERIIARDGKESILSMSVKAFGTPRIVAPVSRGAFNPPPTVDSAILAIENISDARFREKKLGVRHFFRTLRAGFAHKRKYLIRNLETIAEGATIQAVFEKLILDPKIRAEDIGVNEWLGIASALPEKEE